MNGLLPLPEQSEWLRSNGTYTIDWEAPEVMDRIKTTVDFLTKGCECKKGCGDKGGCGCVRKKKSYCGPGCECRCVNLPHLQSQLGSSDEDDSGSDVDAADSSGHDLELEGITDLSKFPDIVFLCMTV